MLVTVPTLVPQQMNNVEILKGKARRGKLHPTCISGCCHLTQWLFAE